jgi:hypothetical protein
MPESVKTGLCGNVSAKQDCWRASAEALSAAAGGSPATTPLLPPPTAWRWAGYKLRGVEWHYALHRTRDDAEPLYSKEALIEYGRTMMDQNYSSALAVERQLAELREQLDVLRRGIKAPVDAATRDEIDDEVCAIMMTHGPDGHIDGHEELTEMVIRRIAKALQDERGA